MPRLRRLSGADIGWLPAYLTLVMSGLIIGGIYLATRAV